MKTLIVLAFLVAEVFATTTDLSSPPQEKQINSTSDGVLSRAKRFLVFTPNGGVLKFVTGYLGPIDIPPWQNINCLRNLQFQYGLPPNWVTHPPSFPGLTRSQEGRGFSSSSSSNEQKVVADSSRKVAYEVVENILEREGKNGRECLLRTICEVAETPVNHNGLIGELLQLFFTPGKHEKLHQDYRDARKVGLNRVDCEKMYPDCPFGHGLLDSFSIIENFKFNEWLNF